MDQLPTEGRDAVMKRVAQVRSESNQQALRAMALFPTFMLVCYLILIGYFKSKGGYKPVDIGSPHVDPDEAADEY